MKSKLATLIAVGALCAPVTIAQLIPSPGIPEENGLAPKSETVYINLPDTINNGSTESIGVGIAANGNVIIGWEDDGDGLIDQEAVWTLFSPSGSSLTPDMEITSLNPDFAGETLTTKYLSYFRADGTPISGWTSWGPKVKANLFGDGIGMGATSFALGLEVPELADLNVDAGGGGDFPAVQLLTNDGEPIRIVTGLSDSDAEPEGDVRIGDWDYLSNGNIVIAGESRQEIDLVDRFGGAAGDRHAVFRIVDPEGNEVKELSLVSEFSDARVEMWHGIGVIRNGFGIRFAHGGRATVRLFDNDGNPTSGNIDIGELTENEATAGGGRGDGAGFHGNADNAYLIVNSGNDDQGVPQVWATVLNADGTLRYSQATTDDWPLNGPGRVDGAIDASGRVIVVFADASGTFGDVKVIMGRFFDGQGAPLGSTSFISEKEDDFTAFAESRRPRIAWRNGFAVVIWESANSPETAERVVAFRMFGTLEPGSIESVGLTRIVPDTPIITPEADALGNWEPYASVLGNSTFLIEGNTFAEGGVSEQRYVVALQPVDGGEMKTVEGFYDDSGNPFAGQINFSRQNGNPGRVAGDKRPGAVNYMVGGEASPHVLAEFNSDGRFDLGFDRGGDGRYGTVQAFSLDPATLIPTPTSTALDAINGRLDFGGGGGQLGRFGGDIAALDNGNFVVVVDDRSGALDPSTSSTAVIIAPDGSIVTESFLVETRDLWSNVAAYKGGFAVRVHESIHFFDNSGTLLGTINQDTSGESFDTGRGDGTRISAHINSPFLYLAGKVTGSTTVKLAVWDSRDQSFVTVADVSEPAFAGDFDRVNLAVDALDRVTVAWDSQPAGYGAIQVATRILAFDGSSITPMTASFLPFVNAAKEGGIRTTRMSVAMTTREIMIAAKGEINLSNNPAAGADSPGEINFYTVISHPDPMDDPTTPVGGGGSVTLDVRVADGADDSEEHLTEGNTIDLTSSDLELGAEGGGADAQVQGIRFQGIDIPAGSVITSASIQFTVDEADDEPTSVQIYGELSADPAAYSDAVGDITSRARTSAVVAWNDIPVWDDASIGTAGPDQLTPDLSSVVQEIIDQASWSAGNAIAFIIEGGPDSERTAESFNGDADGAPLLHVEYGPAGTGGGGGGGGALKALFVVGTDSVPDLNASDAGVKAHLESLGFAVTLANAPESTTEDAAGMDLIVTSATVNSGDVGDKFQATAIPVVNWEQALQDNYLTTGNEGSDRGTIDGQTTVEIVNSTHALSSGLLPGISTVTTSELPHSWGLPTSGAVTIAHVEGDPSQVVVYGYEAGAAMFDGAVAPARRVMLFGGNDAFAAATAEGVALYDAAFRWAAGLDAAPVGPALSIGLNFGADEPDGGNLFGLTEDEAAGAPAVVQSNWNNVSGASGSGTDLVANAGGAQIPTGITVDWASNGSWASTGRSENNGTDFRVGTADFKLMGGYLDTGDPTTTLVTVSDVPDAVAAAGYDVYVYANGGVAAGRSGAYRVLDAGTGEAITDYVLATSATSPTDYIQVPSDSGAGVYGEGTHIVFGGITATSIIIEATTDNGLGAGAPARAPINALQLVAPSAAGGGGGINTDGLVAYWGFDGDLTDSVGSYDGTAQGPVGFEAGQAGFGQAISLDGTGFVEIMDSATALDFAGGSLSISGWFTVGSFDKSWQALIAKGEQSAYRVARRGGGAAVAYAGGVGEGADDAPAVDDGGWHHFVAISDASAADFGTAIYIDGVMYGVQATAPALEAETTNLYIGENPEALNRQWIGLIDDISLWDRVLSAGEVSALYNGGAGVALSTAVGGGGGGITISRSATGVTITFEGTLQSSDSVTGPYSDVAGATSPADIPLSGAAQFFRSSQ